MSLDQAAGAAWISEKNTHNFTPSLESDSHFVHSSKTLLFFRLPLLTDFFPTAKEALCSTPNCLSYRIWQRVTPRGAAPPKGESEPTHPRAGRAAPPRGPRPRPAPGAAPARPEAAGTRGRHAPCVRPVRVHLAARARGSGSGWARPPRRLMLGLGGRCALRVASQVPAARSGSREACAPRRVREVSSSGGLEHPGFLRPHRQHAEVPRPGIEPPPQR